ncbi:MAG: Sensor histidine kinase RcsC [Desulfovibrio sp.]
MSFRKIIKPYFQQLLFVFLAFATMVAVSFWYVKDVVQEQAEINGNAAIDSADATVRTLLAETEISLMNVAFTVEELIARGESQQAVSSLLKSMSEWYYTRAQRYFTFTGIYGYIRGQHFNRTGWVEHLHFHPLTQSWYAGALQTEGIYYSVPYVDSHTGRVYITASQKIFDKNREFCGVVAMDFDISAASSFIRNLQSVNGGYCILLNDKLQILAHKNNDFLGMFFGSTIPAYYKLAEDLLQGEIRISAEQLEDYDGVESVVFMSWLFNGWYIGTVTPISVYNDRLRTMAVALVILGGTLSAILCFFLIRLYSAKEEADIRSRSKTSFLARMSHEIRTPMNAILGMTELILRDKLTLPKKTYESALVIRQAGQNLLTIINDILDLTKIEAGKIDLVSEQYSLASLLNDVINIMRRRIYEKNLRLVVAVDSRIPNNLLGDEVRVRQILLNLLTNAVKYTDTGYIRLSFDMASKTENTVVLQVAVADTGKGIRQEDMDKLFEDFVRLDMTANKSVEGTGLGLAITKSLVARMGGDIRVASVYGKGSCFTVDIPQEIAGPEPFAVVEKPELHNALIVGETDLYLASLSEALDNLGVRNSITKTVESFATRLAEEAVTFIFVEQSVLPSAREILRNQKAKVVVLSDMLRGSAWGYHNLVLPCHSLSVANALNNVNDDTAESMEKDGGVTFQAPSARILVVDDIRTNLKVVEGLMLPYKVQMDFCLGGDEAILLAKSAEYDFVLMDHMMPGMDGVEAARRIKSLPGRSHLPIIALTANAVSGMREFFLDKGMDDFLEKPIEPAKLEALLAKWIPKEKQKAFARAEISVAGSIFDGWFLPGVDFVAGLERFAGNDDAYLQVIRSFVVHTPAVLESLDYSSREALRDFSIAVHGIKGSGAGIGAEDLAAIAQSLESAAKSGDMDTVAAKTPLFIKMAESLVQGLNALLGNIARQPEEKGVRTAPDTALLQKLYDACCAYDLNVMEETVRELEKFVYTDTNPIPWLRKQVDTLEYESLQGKLREMLANADGKDDHGGSNSCG